MLYSSCWVFLLPLSTRWPQTDPPLGSPHQCVLVHIIPRSVSPHTYKFTSFLHFQVQFDPFSVFFSFLFVLVVPKWVFCSWNAYFVFFYKKNISLRSFVNYNSAFWPFPSWLLLPHQPWPCPVLLASAFIKSDLKGRLTAIKDYNQNMSNKFISNLQEQVWEEKTVLSSSRKQQRQNRGRLH